MNRRLFISRRASGGLSGPLTAFSLFHMCHLPLCIYRSGFSYVFLSFVFSSSYSNVATTLFPRFILSILTCKKLASSKRLGIPFRFSKDSTVEYCTGQHFSGPFPFVQSWVGWRIGGHKRRLWL
ncbi:hypothetical protein HDV63DRAFT_365666 [Trichoderma sp. SZMC 28014]